MYKAQYFSPLEHIFPSTSHSLCFFFRTCAASLFSSNAPLHLFYSFRQRIAHSLGVLDFSSSHTQCQLIVTLSHSLFTSSCYTPPHIFFFANSTKKKYVKTLYIFFFSAHFPLQFLCRFSILVNYGKEII